MDDSTGQVNISRLLSTSEDSELLLTCNNRGEYLRFVSFARSNETSKQFLDDTFTSLLSPETFPNSKVVSSKLALNGPKLAGKLDAGTGGSIT